MPNPTAADLEQFTDNYGQNEHGPPISTEGHARPKHPLLVRAEAVAQTAGMKAKITPIWRTPPVRQIVTRQGFILIPGLVYRFIPDLNRCKADLFSP